MLVVYETSSPAGQAAREGRQPARERPEEATIVTRPGRARSGQAMVEYVITAGMLILCVAILAVFLYTFNQYGDRVFELVADDWP
ncbi:MAG: hypothetical protein FJ225_00705 [Lentisphaerae bacterium]|nr:hypothetical protein [Lentisphaerota bacterium]